MRIIVNVVDTFYTQSTLTWANIFWYPNICCFLSYIFLNLNTTSRQIFQNVLSNMFHQRLKRSFCDTEPCVANYSNNVKCMHIFTIGIISSQCQLQFLVSDRIWGQLCQIFHHPTMVVCVNVLKKGNPASSCYVQVHVHDSRSTVNISFH